MKFPFETDFVKISLDETKQMALVLWLRPVSITEYQEGIRAYMALLSETKVKRSLLNSTLRGDLELEADAWVLSTLKNNIAHLEVQDHQLALVMTEKKYQELIHNYSLLQSGTIDLPISIHYFTNHQEALDWLTNGGISFM